MAFGVNRDYKTAGRKAQRDLARHNEIMQGLITAGIPRDEASKMAFDEVRTENKKGKPALDPRLKNARTCEGCTAFNGAARSYENSCGLGFNNNGPFIKAFGIRRAIPQEPCPKPKTIQAFIDAPKRREFD